MKSTKWLLGIAVLMSVVGVGAPRRTFGVTAADKSPITVDIKIDNFSFVPAVITIPAGTTIRWTNRDDIPHTVVSDDHTTFKSKPLDTDDQFTYTFTKPGTYSYFCSIHPRMTGKVVVQ